MQYIDLFLSLVSLMLCFAFLSDQPMALAWLFAIINRLRRARKARRCSIEEAAWQVGVDTSTYHRWELGTQKPHGRNKRKLEAAFQMKASEFFEKEPYEQEIDKLIERLLTDYRPTLEPIHNTAADIEVVAHEGRCYLYEAKACRKR